MEGIWMKCAFVLLLASLCATSARATDQPKSKITNDEARTLVMASLTNQQRRLPSLGAESYDDPDSPRFLFFTVTWEGLPNGSVVVGNYAVDRNTGDVFSATMSCYEEKNKRLKRLQAQVRSQLHLTRSEYLRLKTNGPLCER
jgi:hypothetical protein